MAATVMQTLAVGRSGAAVRVAIGCILGVVVTSDRPIFVERALYNNANGVFWAAGSNATGTAVP